ncbi:MAG: Rieske (2Fe-2S) protein [Myxococcales bacterium]|nr:Rieske (2Fe-2S) protein [Myxococcales bacterium]
MSAAEWHPLGPLAELEADTPIGRQLDRADGTRAELVLVRHGDRVHAFHDRCPHRAAPLSTLGLVDAQAGTLICGWHYWAFRLADGAHADVPGITLCGYPTRLTAAGEVEVDLSPRPNGP